MRATLCRSASINSLNPRPPPAEEAEAAILSNLRASSLPRNEADEECYEMNAECVDVVVREEIQTRMEEQLESSIYNIL